MNERLSKMFKNIREIDPPANLKFLIIQRIEGEKIKTLKRKMIFSRLGMIGSSLAILAVLPTLEEYLIKSDFWSLIYLAFSDLAIVAQNWKEFGFSLMENFPALPLAFILVPICTLMFSAGSYFNLISHNQHKYI